jgi:hypothetical protein
MLVPERLTRFAGEPIADAHVVPLPDVDSKSGSSILAVETNGGAGPRFVLKRISLEADWIMRATEDWRCREVSLWQTGTLDRLPHEIEHAVLAAALDGSGWALLMRDVGDTLISWADQPETPLAPDDNAAVLDSLAALHTSFWEASSVPATDLGLCSLRNRYTVMSPSSARKWQLPYAWPRWLTDGWQQLRDFVTADVAVVLYALLENPEPLCAALRRYPHTLIHGDPRVTNIGLIREADAGIVLLDWALAGIGPPGIDLAWYLADLIPPTSYDDAVADYRESLARRLGTRFAEDWWLPQLELSLLGCILQFGWAIAEQMSLGYPQMVLHWSLHGDWWCEQVRRGARWLPS